SKAAVRPESFEEMVKADAWQPVVVWELTDRNRVILIPPDHWLLVRDKSRFRASLKMDGETRSRNIESIEGGGDQIGYFRWSKSGAATLEMERYKDGNQQVQARVIFLSAKPSTDQPTPKPTDIALLTNGRGGM